MEIHFLFNVFFEDLLRFERLARVCGVVASSDNFVGKEEGYYLHVDLSSTLWMSTYRV